MARAALITETDRTNIAMVFQQNPKERPEKIRLRVIELSKREIGLGTIQREMAKLRKAHKAGEDTDAFDEIWHMGTFQDIPLPAEFVPLALELQEKSQRLTIRQILWMSRLYKITPDIEKLLLVSLYYTIYERACKIAGISCNTTKFDAGTVEKIEGNFDKYFKDSLKGGPLQNDPLVVKLDGKLKSKTKPRIEYDSLPMTVTDHQVGDLVLTNDTKEIVKIVKIENGAYFTEPASPAETKLWHEMKTDKNGK
jgi:hypothetical protein